MFLIDTAAGAGDIGEGTRTAAENEHLEFDAEPAAATEPASQSRE